MTTGDCLPGFVVDFRPGNDSLYSPSPSHFVVRYDGPNSATLERQSTLLRINASYVRRIVWSRRRNNSWQPRTAFLRDGSFLRFRSIRWSAGIGARAWNPPLTEVRYLRSYAICVYCVE